MTISGMSTLQQRLFLLCTILIVSTSLITSSAFLYIISKNNQEQLRLILIVVFIISSLTMLVALLVMVLLSKQSVQFIGDLTDSAQSIAGGDFDKRIDRAQSGELGTLASSFVHMRDALKKQISGLQRLTLILESTSDLIAIATIDAQVVYINNAGRRLIDLPQHGSLDDLNITSIFPTGAVEQVSQYGTWQGESTVIGIDGVVVPVSQVIMPHMGDDGEVKYYSTIVRDISEPKCIEDELRNSEKVLRATLNSIGDGVMVIDANGYITEFNPVAEKLTGWSSVDAKSSHWAEVLNVVNISTKEHAFNNTQLLAEAFNTNRAGIDSYLLLSKQGKEYQISLSYSQIVAEDSSTHGSILVFRDESEKSMREKNLHQAQKMEAVGTLAGALAHDFNNILSGIFAPISILEHRIHKGQPPTEEKLVSSLSMMRNAAERAVDMVKQLLTLSHRMDSASTSLDLNVSINDVLEIVEKTFDKSIIINFSSSDKEAWISGDPTQIEQVLLNLCINSAHAMTIMRKDDHRKGGKLDLTIKKILVGQDVVRQYPSLDVGEYFHVSIKDTGVGMDDECMANMFTPFYTTKQKGMGTGIGLSMVYNIVEKHKGLVTVSSEVNIGTDINLFFPALLEIEERAEQSPEDNIYLGTGHILVVDDEELLRRTICDMLEDCGYETLAAESGIQCLEKIKRFKGKLAGVVLDMVMPEMTGEETCEHLLAIDQDIKVLLVSGLNNSNNRVQRIQGKGAQGFLQKPFSIEKLSKAVYLAFRDSR